MTLRERVFAALNGMVANGYEDTKTDDPALIAADLTASDEFGNLRDDEMVELQDFIVEWQESFT